MDGLPSPSCPLSLSLTVLNLMFLEVTNCVIRMMNVTIYIWPKNANHSFLIDLFSILGIM